MLDFADSMSMKCLLMLIVHTILILTGNVTLSWQGTIFSFLHKTSFSSVHYVLNFNELDKLSLTTWRAGTFLNPMLLGLVAGEGNIKIAVPFDYLRVSSMVAWTLLLRLNDVISWSCSPLLRPFRWPPTTIIQLHLYGWRALDLFTVSVRCSGLCGQPRRSLLLLVDGVCLHGWTVN